MSTLDNGVFCVVCENAALKECDRLVAENAELRAKLVMHEGAQKHNEKLINSERDKNKKLQQLVKKMIKVIRFHGGWYGLWIDAARELGIEVSE